MNNIYVNRNRIPVNTTKQDKATKAINKIIERDKQSRERSEQILDYYRNGKQKGVRI